MQACCFKCKTTTPEPVACPMDIDEVDPIQAYWFLLDNDGDPIHMGINEGGEVDYNFKVSTDLDLEVTEDEAPLVYCPECMSELMDNLEDNEDEDEDEDNEQES